MKRRVTHSPDRDSFPSHLSTHQVPSAVYPTSEISLKSSPSLHLHCHCPPETTLISWPACYYNLLIGPPLDWTTTNLDSTLKPVTLLILQYPSDHLLLPQRVFPVFPDALINILSSSAWSVRPLHCLVSTYFLYSSLATLFAPTFLLITFIIITKANTVLTLCQQYY